MSDAPLLIATLSNEGAHVAARLAQLWPQAEVTVHESVNGYGDWTRFGRVADCISERWARVRGIVFIGPCGVAVRSIAPLIESKLRDPAVIVLDVGARWAVSLLSGHEGGANALAVEAANLFGAEPVISTTSEAVRTIIAGVGCRRGTSCDCILALLDQGLAQAGVTRDDLRLLATAEVKRDEPGLHEAAAQLGVPLRIIPDSEIRACAREFATSEFVSERVGLPAVAEPAALLAGRRTTFLLRRIQADGATVALARESCPWSASAPDTPSTAPAAPKT